MEKDSKVIGPPNDLPLLVKVNSESLLKNTLPRDILLAKEVPCNKNNSNNGNKDGRDNSEELDRNGECLTNKNEDAKIPENPQINIVEDNSFEDVQKTDMVVRGEDEGGTGLLHPGANALIKSTVSLPCLPQSVHKDNVHKDIVQPHHSIEQAGTRRTYEKKHASMYLPCTSSLSCSSLHPKAQSASVNSMQSLVMLTNKSKAPHRSTSPHRSPSPHRTSTQPLLPNIHVPQSKGQKQREGNKPSFKHMFLLPKIKGIAADGAQKGKQTAVVKQWKQHSRVILAACHLMPPQKASYLPSPGTWSISKGQVTRAVVLFSRPTPPRPLTLVVHFPVKTQMCHSDVLALFRSILAPVPDARVMCIQYIDRNVMLGSRGQDNRWLVSVNNEETLLYLLEQQSTVQVWRYDDVARTEYHEHKKHRQFLRHLKQVDRDT